MFTTVSLGVTYNLHVLKLNSGYEKKIKSYYVRHGGNTVKLKLSVNIILLWNTEL